MMRGQGIGRGALAGAFVASALAVGACEGGGEPRGAEGLSVTTAALAPCVDNENGNRTFPSGADRVVTRITGGEIPADQPIVTSFSQEQGASGSVVITNVPPGQGMRLEVVGCQGAEVVWAGRSEGLSVTAHMKSFPDVFLTPVGEMACVGRATTPEAQRRSSVARAFAAESPTADGALLLGGFTQFDPQTKAAPATATVERYDLEDSAFTVAGDLTGPRGGALARPLANGSVLVAGGTKALAVALAPNGALQRAYPMIWSLPADRPDCGFEAFDPETGTASCLSTAVLPALPTMAAYGVEGVVAVGGVVADPADPRGVPTTQVTTRSGAAEATFDMAHARFGATVVALGADRALVFGGNADGDPAHAAELLDLSAGTASALDVSGLTAIPVLAAGTYLGTDASGRHRVLVAGGGDVRTTFPQYVGTVATPRLDLLTVDTTAGTVGVSPVDAGGDAALFQRAAARLQPLPSGGLWLLGGITSFTKTEAICGDAPDCLPADTLTFTVDEAGTFTAVRDLDLSVGPMGSTPVGLTDGSWLVAGGFTTVSAAAALDRGANLVRFAPLAPELCATP